MTDLCWMTARALRDALAARQVSAVEVLSAHLRQIELVNPQLNAIVSLAADSATQTARELDRQPGPIGPLHGLPVAIKDLVETAGIRTTYGSRIYADHVPLADALIVKRLRAAGAVVLGKTNTPEFGAGSQTFNDVFGPTRNPWSPDLTAGGSSGGAAAALAAGMVPLADGSDLGGSLRNPAAFCGVVGMRPAPGRVPDLGGGLWDPHSVLGPMARTVDDAALMLSVIAGPDVRAPLSLRQSPLPFAHITPSDLRHVRIAWSRTLGGLPVHPDIAVTLDAARQKLIGLGCNVDEAEPDLSGADEVFETLRALAMLAAFGQDATVHPDLVKPEIHDELRWAGALRPEDLVRALQHRDQLYSRVVSFLTRYDVIAAPVTQVVPFDVTIRWPSSIGGIAMDRYYTWMRSCSRISATTLPALSLPAGLSPDGLPVGLQLIGQPHGELELLKHAAAVEEILSVGRPTVARQAPISGSGA
ncbi:MAG: amidase [Solirubrobacteraceae bacterium]